MSFIKAFVSKHINAAASHRPTGQEAVALFFYGAAPDPARIAELVGAQPVTIQAAELPQALATGVVNAFMTSGSTGYDSKSWETMTHFYDTQAWIPKNVTFVNKAAFDALDKPTQQAILKAAAVAEERGWKLAEEKAKWYLEQLSANKMKVLPPPAAPVMSVAASFACISSAFAWSC